MTGNRSVCRILCLAVIYQIFHGEVEAILWRAEQRVNYYSQYASVVPARFFVPSDRGEATWHFRATKSPESCDHKSVHIYLQFGSLPVVNPLNESLPDHFLLDQRDLMLLEVETDNVSVSHTEQYPQGGDWYAVAFIPEVNIKIKQKGLAVSCEYKFSASMELKELPPYLHIDINTTSQVALTGPEGDGIWVGFKAPHSARSVEVDVSNCALESCEVQLSTLSYEVHQVKVVNCSNVDNVTCTLRLNTPAFNTKHYVHLQLTSPGNTTALVAIRTEDCPLAKESANSTNSCVLENKLDRYQKQGDFNTDFVRLQNNTVEENEFILTNTSVTVIPFDVERTIDIGGTLNVKVAFKLEDVGQNQHVRVCGHLTVNRFPMLNDGIDLCTNSTDSFQVNSSSEASDGSVSAGLYVPYPEEGFWMLALSMQCYNSTNDSFHVVDCVNGTQKVILMVKIERCVDNSCNGQGACEKYITSADFIVFSTCVCTAGWRGYGCTDGSEAYSDKSQLIEVLLLTLSNLFFLPAIFVALYRRYYIEAMVYFYNMFFSTFYHACDGDRIEKYVYCLTHYSVLAIGDFLASTISLWVTLIAMAQIPLNYSSMVQMAGPLALIVGVLLDRTSLWLIAVPTGGGLLLVFLAWITRCCRNKRCFPEKRLWFWMLPGVVFAVCGAIMFAFFETTKNYKYIHSAWHMCLSLCIIFLLPPRRKEKEKEKKTIKSVNFDDTESTEGLVLGPNNYTRRLNFEL